MRAEVWEAVPDIDAPCQEISFSYIPEHMALVRMSFGDPGTGIPRALSLKFKNVVVLCGEEECPGGFVRAPKELPMLGTERYSELDFSYIETPGLTGAGPVRANLLRRGSPSASSLLSSFLAQLGSRRRVGGSGG
jgi:hypothetical protein